jgi:hypothetical protein
METETLDKLYLEYSQMTTARTCREITLEKEVTRLLHEKGTVPRHLLLALANATEAFDRNDIYALGTINEHVQPLVDAAIAWHRRHK